MDQKAEVFLGVVTWMGVIFLTFSGWQQPIAPMPDMNLTNLVLAASLFLGFLLCFLLVDAKLPVLVSAKQKHYLLLVASFFVLALSLLFYFSYVAILAIILVSQLVGLIRLKLVIAYALLMPVLGGLIDGMLKGAPNSELNTLLFILFNLFALIASYRFYKERLAKEESKMLLRELKATQFLLSAATKRDERLRIARELHDVVGHQLTALSLQLEVASHLEGDSMHPHIQQAKRIGSALLDDVRKVVSEIRDTKALDLEEALQTLVRDVPGLAICLHFQPGCQVNNARQVEVIFRSVQEALTNTLKHANARRFEVTVSQNPTELQLAIRDDGIGCQSITPGNGLMGMRERIEKLDGILDVCCSDKGVELHIRLPIIDIGIAQ